MKIGTFYGTTLRVHPSLPLILLLYTLSGQGVMICAYSLALLLHELGHWYAASRLSLPVYEIELTPFGGVMRIDLSEGVNGRRGVGLAAAGILVNLFCLLFSGLILVKTAYSVFMGWFALANLSMAAVNLLPALPLDGGRMLLSVLSAGRDRRKTFRFLLGFGRILAASLLVCSLISAIRGHFKPLWAILGCYLLYAASLEEKHSTARYLSAFYARRYRLVHDTAVPVQYLCVSGDITLFRLLPQLQPNAYHMIAVMDEDGEKITGTVYEHQLYDAILASPSAAIKELLSGQQLYNAMI